MSRWWFGPPSRSRRCPIRYRKPGSRSPSSARSTGRTTTPPEPIERTGYIGLGSNVGDREDQLRAAIDDLRRREVEVEAVSSLYETEPVGEILDQPDFLNAVARIRTSLEPEELLDVCKAIEVEHGRDLGGPRHGPRPIDLDLLVLGDLELSTERLTLPHAEATARRFVLVPLLELDPDLVLPDGTSLGAALEAIEGERVERVAPPPA